MAYKDKTKKKLWQQRNAERLNAEARQRRAENPEKYRQAAREYMRRWYSKNREKGVARAAAWRAANPGKAQEMCRKWRERKPGYNAYARAAAAKWRRAHPELVREMGAMKYMRTRHEIREKNLKHFYGLTLDDYAVMLSAQGGKCASCRLELVDDFTDRRRRPNVDHDHASGRVRGLLCGACNRAAGLLGDDPQRLEALAAYLRRHPAAA